MEYPAYDTELQLEMRHLFSALGNVKISSLLLPHPRFILIVLMPIWVSFMSQIELFKTYLYTIGLCEKKNNKKTF